MTKYKRHLQASLIQTLKNSPATLLIGARQTGKTTLVQEIGKELGSSYISFDDLFAQGSAEADPIGFVDSIQKPAILDEVQGAPKIFLPLKKDIDRNRVFGRYLLTGSANPLVIPKLGDSLAGRMQILHLWPLSQGELIGKQETFIDKIFSSSTPQMSIEPMNKEHFIRSIERGGYPAIQHVKNEKERYHWCNSYLTTLIQKDITDLARIENLRSIPNILQILAARAGNLLNERDLARNVGIPLTTIHRYLQLLQHLFLVSFLPGWYRNLEKRIVKAPKIYFVDTAILLHLLGFNIERIMSNPNILGHVVENFIIVEIFKQMTWSETIVRPFHFRVHDGSEEVDLVLESTSGKLVGIEIKSSETVTADDFKGLKKLQISSKNDFLRGIVFYIGSQQLPFGQNLVAMPISSLWS